MKFETVKKYETVIFFILFLTLMTSCRSNKFKQVWDTVTIDTNISKNTIYSQLDKQKEIFSALEEQNTLSKRTSDVEYSRGKQRNVGAFNNLKINNCRAYYYHQSDTLSINIGIGNGFGGQGFIINYKGNKFYTEPYFSTDVIIIGEPEPTYKIIYQKLTLDKPNYSLGDSLYGYIDFKSIETDKRKDTAEHWGKGYFRTKITKF